MSLQWNVIKVSKIRPDQSIIVSWCRVLMLCAGIEATLCAAKPIDGIQSKGLAHTNDINTYTTGVGLDLMDDDDDDVDDGDGDGGNVDVDCRFLDRLMRSNKKFHYSCGKRGETNSWSKNSVC